MSDYFHKPFCEGREHSDAAKRLSDTYNLHRTAGDTLGITAIGKWFAAALQDGESDGVLYDTRRDCVLHQKHNEQRYTFIKIGPYSMNYCEAEVMLRVARKAYDAGMRLVDPEEKHGGRELIKRLTTEDQLALALGRATNLVMPRGYPNIYHPN